MLIQHYFSQRRGGSILSNRLFCIPAVMHPMLWLVFLCFAIGCASTGGLVDFNRVTSMKELPKQDNKLWDLSKYETDYLQKSGLVYSDSVLGNYLQKVGMKVLPEDLKSSIIPFRFQVILDPELNAFALPDGNIFLHLGLLARLENESQLAQVLGHEITHVVRRHAVYRYAQIKNVVGFTQILSVATGIGFASMGSNWAGFWNSIAQSSLYLTAMASINGYGRAEEKEADLTALRYMSASKYDLHEAPKVFEILLDEYNDPSATAAFFYSNHPRLKSRIKYVKARVETIGNGPSTSASMATQKDDGYKQRTDLVRRKAVELWVRSGKYNNAIKDAKKVLDDHPDDATVRFWLAEALRQKTANADTLALARDEYFNAIRLDSTFAEPHRGLAAIAEAQQDLSTATQEYHVYLDLSPKAKDRRFVISRIETLTAKVAMIEK